MKYLIDDKTLDQIQETSGALMHSTKILTEILFENLSFILNENARYSKDEIIGQADAIRILAQQLDLSIVEAEPVYA